VLVVLAFPTVLACSRSGLTDQVIVGEFLGLRGAVNSGSSGSEKSQGPSCLGGGVGSIDVMVELGANQLPSKLKKG